MDGETVQLNLYSPLDNLLGFEHAPRTEEERRAVRSMAAKLHQADSLFVFTPSARCQLESADLQSATLPPELLAAVSPSGKSERAAASSRGGETSKPLSSPSSPVPHAHAGHEAQDAHEAQHSHGAHAELEAVWVFHCSVPQALQALDVGLFRAFSGLRRSSRAGPNSSRARAAYQRQ